MAVIKADAYGHGIIRTAQALQGADGFAVAHVAEAMILRQAGIDKPLLLLEGVGNGDELELAAAHDLIVCVHARHQLQLLAETTLSKPVDTWLKIDTGMHRLGFLPEQAASVRQRLRELSSVNEVSVVMTHLCCADQRDVETSARQIEQFGQTIDGWDCRTSIANSAGILGWPASHGDWVRPGIMLYGVSPFIDDEAGTYGLRPVMTLRSSLIALRKLRKGDAVGYGATWRCPEDMPVGVIGAGYGDGYPRVIAEHTPLLVNGRPAPRAGRVSMDMICVDLRDQPDAKPGDPVTLWGEGLPVERIAAAAQTIGYELLCRVTARVSMHYTE